MATSRATLLAAVEQDTKKKVPEIRTGDTVRVHAKIVEGSKERVQIFEGIVVARHNRGRATATFTVRKVSYTVGVERTFPLYSPRIEKIEVVSHGDVRRSRLYYLRDLRGKASRIKGTKAEVPATGSDVAATEVVAEQPAA